MKQWVLGGKEHSWGSFLDPLGSAVVDTTTDPGWLQPMRLNPAENLSSGIRTGKGWIYSNDGSMELTGQPRLAVDGDHSTAVVTTGGWRGAGGLTFWVDLGATFGVDRIRFYPREGFPQRLIRRYRIYVNDGRDVAPILVMPGEVIWTSVARWDTTGVEWRLVTEKKENTTIDVGIPIPLQHVRYIKLIITDTFNMPEIDEFEVYGQGYVPRAIYPSKVIDLGGIADFGDLTPMIEVDPDASIILQTRSGKTPEPYLYHKKTGVGPTGQTRVSKDDYYKLHVNQRGTIELDTENWSFWSAPYDLQKGREAMLSPWPRRYIQCMIEFLSRSPWSGIKINSLSFEYARPPIAHRVVAEIAPQIVSPGVTTAFRYAILATFESGDTGFDALEIATPIRVDPATVRDLLVGGVPIVDFSTRVEADRLNVMFPQNRVTTNGVIVELTFDCKVLLHGTRFIGRVFDSQGKSLSQQAMPGDATPSIVTNDFQISWKLGGSLISSVDVSPNPFSPNGDGINDILRISYSLLQLTTPAPVTVGIYNLAGIRVWGWAEDQINGVYTVAWDGRRDRGGLVPPGIYPYCISVEANAGVEVRDGTIIVVY